MCLWGMGIKYPFAWPCLKKVLKTLHPADNRQTLSNTCKKRAQTYDRVVPSSQRIYPLVKIGEFCFITAYSSSPLDAITFLYQ